MCIKRIYISIINKLCVLKVLVLGAWYLVLGTWYLVLGTCTCTWYLVLGTWYLVLGTWYLVLGTSSFFKVFITKPARPRTLGPPSQAGPAQDPWSPQAKPARPRTLAPPSQAGPAQDPSRSGPGP